MPWPIDETVNDLTAEELLKQITDGKAKCEGTDALAWPLVKLDRFKCQGHGGTAGASGYLGSGSANEHHVDDYIKEFVRAVIPLIEFFDWDTLYNIILATRNGSSDRDRLKAAQEIAAVGPYYVIVKEILEEAGYTLVMDSREYRDVWLLRDDFQTDCGFDEKHCFNTDQMEHFTGLCIRLQPEGVYIGDGDGYHRAYSERCVSYSEVEIKQLPVAIDKYIEDWKSGLDYDEYNDI